MDYKCEYCDERVEKRGRVCPICQDEHRERTLILEPTKMMAKGDTDWHRERQRKIEFYQARIAAGGRLFDKQPPEE